jgi:hypothetical protein
MVGLRRKLAVEAEEALFVGREGLKILVNAVREMAAASSRAEPRKTHCNVHFVLLVGVHPCVWQLIFLMCRRRSCNTGVEVRMCFCI